MRTADAYRWTILGLGTFCILTFGVIFQSIPPLIGILVEALHISYAQAGALMGLFILPGIFLSLPGGMLTDRFGPLKAVIASLLSLALGTAIVALSGSYWLMAFGRLIAGAGATVLLVVAPKIVASWFYDREIGLAMGVFNISMPLGTILSLNFMGAIAFRFNWKASIWVSFAVGVATIGLFLLLYRSKSTGGEVKPETAGLVAAVKKAGGSAWLVGLSWGLFNAGLISFFTYAPDYFISRGESVARAGLLASYPMWGSIVLAPVVGLLIDRLGHKWVFVAAGCGGTAVLLYLIPGFNQHAAFLSICIGVFVAILTPAIFSLPAELLPESVMGFGFGILGTCAGIGMAVGPYVVGSLRDATGDYLWSFAAMTIFPAIGIIPMLMLRMKK
ncbi:MAG: MFS transporter [Deltaproteobacteria bacterium]|jgi:MFS family permease|nr:MFS transporter [Deltaproteobacteria bacterium]